MQLYKLILGMDIPKRCHTIKPYFKQMHGFILRAIHEIDSELSTELHNNKNRQAFSFRMLPHRQVMIITTIDKRVIHALQRYFLQHSFIQTPLFSARIQNVQLTTVSTEDTFGDFSHVMLSFISPTAFSHNGKYYPLPEPQRIFSSAMKIYNECVPEEEKLEWEQLSEIVADLMISFVDIKTVPVDFEKHQVIGFEGKVSFSCKKLKPEQRSIIGRLGICMDSMGVGVKTAWGLGAVEVTLTEV